MSDKLFRLIGLAKRAGGLVCGSDAAISAVRRRSSCVVVLATDVSANTAKRVTDKCTSYKARLLVGGTRQRLGQAVGAELVSCVAVTEPHLAKAMIEEFYGGGANDETKSE